VSNWSEKGRITAAATGPGSGKHLAAECDATCDGSSHFGKASKRWRVGSREVRERKGGAKGGLLAL